MLNKTWAPIKYLLATSVLKLTENHNFSDSDVHESNVLYILKVLQSNLKFLDNSLEDNLVDEHGAAIIPASRQDGSGTAEQGLVYQEQYKGLKFKAHKYCLLAMTNILLKTNCEYIFARKHKLVPLEELILNDRTSFEKDPQMNLRFLTLINMAFQKEPTNQDRQEL